MKIQVSPKLSLHVRAEGTGPTVLLIHGWMMASAVFEPVAQALLDAGYRVVRPDLRGAGRSGAADSYALADYVADLCAVLDVIGPAIVVGHSMGGQIAQLLAIEEPERVRGLVLLNPVPAAGLPLPEDAMGLFSTSAGDRDKQRTILGLATTQLGEEAMETLLDIAATVQPAAIEKSLRAWTAGGFAARLGEITAPAHVVATSDPFLPPEFLTEAVVKPIPDASLHRLDGPGHYPTHEAPEPTASLLVDLLATMLPVSTPG